MPYTDDGIYHDLYTDAHYGGAPDECSIHWPTKIIDGVCQECEEHKAMAAGTWEGPPIDAAQAAEGERALKAYDEAARNLFPRAEDL